jgi:probable F420-dependent oxidoreductase
LKFSIRMPGMSWYPAFTLPWHRVMQPPDFRRFASRVDHSRFSCIIAGEHLVMPGELVDTMGPYWHDGMTSVAFIAGATQRVSVSAQVIVLPYHHPVAMARRIATLDVVSGGRVRLAFGVGHAEREFAALGVPFHDRGALADEYLDAMVELWTKEEPCFRGRTVAFGGILFEPKPVQKPYPPIWIGGGSKAALRRAARYDGWIVPHQSWLRTRPDVPECLEYIRSQAAYGDETRPFDVAMDLEILITDEDLHSNGSARALTEGRRKQELIDAIRRLHDVGVTWTKLPDPRASTFEEHLDYVDWVSEEIIPHFV